MPNPGTIVLPFGTSGAFTVACVVVVLGVTELPVELLVVVDAIVEVLCTVATEVAGVSTVVVNAVMSCTITGSGGMMGAVVTWFRTLFGFVGLIGLIGDAGLFRFVDVILQVLYISNQVVQVGEPYGSEQIEVLCSCDNPSKPAGHVSVLVSVLCTHVGGSGVQLLEDVVHPVQDCEVHS